MRKLTHEEILALRQENKSLPWNPIAFLLNDIRSLYNVGAIFRIADGLRAQRMYLCGITGKPPERPITKTALGAERIVPWEYHENAHELVQELKVSGHQIVVMEHTDESIPYDEIGARGHVPLQFPICLIVGNEVSGVDPDLVSLADLAVEIPMCGEKNSLNVSVAAGIVSYHMLTELEKQGRIFQGSASSRSISR